MSSESFHFPNPIASSAARRQNPIVVNHAKSNRAFRVPLLLPRGVVLSVPSERGVVCDVVVLLTRAVDVLNDAIERAQANSAHTSLKGKLTQTWHWSKSNDAISLALCEGKQEHVVTFTTRQRIRIKITSDCGQCSRSQTYERISISVAINNTRKPNDQLSFTLILFAVARADRAPRRRIDHVPHLCPLCAYTAREMLFESETDAYVDLPVDCLSSFDFDGFLSVFLLLDDSMKKKKCVFVIIMYTTNNNLYRHPSISCFRSLISTFESASPRLLRCSD